MDFFFIIIRYSSILSPKRFNPGETKRARARRPLSAHGYAHAHTYIRTTNFQKVKQKKICLQSSLVTCHGPPRLTTCPVSTAHTTAPVLRSSSAKTVAPVATASLASTAKLMPKAPSKAPTALMSTDAKLLYALTVAKPNLPTETTTKTLTSPAAPCM